MDEDRTKNAANYFMTMAFLTTNPDDFFYDLGFCTEKKLPLPIRAFLAEWRRHTGRARPDCCPELPDEFELADLFNMLNYCIDQILREIVPSYERTEQRRGEKRKRQRRRRHQSAKNRGDIQTPTKEAAR